jgi:hypothetical protein
MTQNTKIKALLLARMRRMWHALEESGVALVVGAEERIVILWKPSVSEFRQAAMNAGVPEPRSWEAFYETTFGPSAVADRSGYLQ